MPCVGATPELAAEGEAGAVDRTWSISRSTTPPASRQNTYSARVFARATAFAASATAATTSIRRAAKMGYRASSRATTE